MQKNKRHGRKKESGNRKLNRVLGIISISAKGTGYVRPADAAPAGPRTDIEIDFRRLNTALHGDTVEVALLPRNGSREAGEVVRVISRAKMRFAGVLQEENRLFFVRPDDMKMYADILIPREELGDARPGQKVLAEITLWSDHRKAPEGRITKVLGAPGNNDAEMHAIAIEKGFDAELPRTVEEEAERIRAAGIRKSDYGRRRDMRNVLTFTIDPRDAKDFDDAISFRTADNGLYEIGIHIADVSHYVKENSLLDKEARERGTSVYLVDRTIPMLPEVLSNDLCSLVPGEDRLCMSAIFIMDKEARVREEWFGRTIIHSQKRFTYEEAEKAIHTSSLPFHKELKTLNEIAKKLTKDRFAKGAISLEQEEVRFVLDDSGVPLRVERKVRGDSNRLIEEFMLLANKKVAEVLSPKEKKGKDARSRHGTAPHISIYRVHDLPNKEKMEDLVFFLRSLGLKVPLVNGVIPSREINKLLARLALEESAMADTVHRAIIRSMAKAVYSTKNIGHYGLAFEHYTHFTSPIRRYPDILVHRLLQNYLDGKRIPADKLEEYEKMSFVASEQEKRAADAERASVKYKQVEYMSKRTGEEFEGIVSGITEWGMYVEEIETKCEGLVRMRDLTDDFYVFNEKKLLLTGQKTKKTYRLGDRARIRVKDVDLERKTIDYALV